MTQESYKYYAFISYSHKDQKTARKLQKYLQNYHLPAALRKTNPSLPKKLSPIFLDESDLAGTNLKNALRENLERSNFLIVMCSPASAKSPYVNDEVQYFIDQGRTDRIIPFIIDGIPHSQDPSQECFTPALLALPREQELLGIDLKKFSMRKALVRLVATLLKLDIDDFVARDEKTTMRRNLFYVSITLALLFLARIMMPPPYDDILAENVMESAVAAYSAAGRQYEQLAELADSAAEKPEEFSQALQRYRNRIPTDNTSYRSSLKYLADMLKTGEVISWSGKPMYKEECSELLTLAENRRDEYSRLADAAEFVMTDDLAKRFYKENYLESLRKILEVDADIAAELYQVVCSPHIAGKYAGDSVKAKRTASLIADVSRQNKHLTGENVKQSRESLIRLKGERKTLLGQIDSSGVLDAYEGKHPKPAAVSQDSHSVPESTPESRLINDLMSYVYHGEKNQSDILWALDYVETFGREMNWEAVQRARVGILAAKRDIDLQKLPGFMMTSADYHEFMSRGIDVSFMENLDVMLASDQASASNVCRAFSTSLMSDVFTSDTLAVCIRNAALNKRISGINIQYLAVTADWVLASLASPDITAEFSRMLEAYCPKVYSFHTSNPANPEELEAMSHEILDSLEATFIESQKLLGAGRNSLHMMEYALDAEDAESLRRNLTSISGLPALVPSPRWLTSMNSEYVYFWYDDDGKIKLAAARTDFKGVPDGCVIRAERVSLNDVKAWITELEAHGLPVPKIAEGNGKFTAAFDVGESSFTVVHEGSRASLFMTKNPVCLMPSLYLKLRPSTTE